MKNKLSLIRLILFGPLLVIINTLNAQWSTHGPYGGPMYAVEAVGSWVYAGTGNNGVFKSADNGQSWTATGLQGKWINAFTSSGTSLFAGAYYDGVYRSTDNGATWQVKNNGLGSLFITSLFTSTAGVFAGTPAGVYYTANNGDTWTSANNGLPSTYDIYSWAGMGDTVYGGTYGLGLYMTTNNGTSWTQVSNGLSAPSPSVGGFYIYALYSEGNNLFAGTNLGIYKSSNRGASWSVSNNGMPSGAFATTFISKPGYIFAGTHSGGIFRSTDGGVNWTAANSGIEDWPSGMGPAYNYLRVNDLAVSGSVVIAATFDGMYRSSDNGSSWQGANNGITGTRIMALAANSGTVYAGENNTGMYISTDKGDTWIRYNNGLNAAAILAAETKGNLAFISVENNKVFKLVNGSWTNASNGLTAQVEILKANSTTVYAITRGGFNYNQKLFQTTDDGNTWTEITGANAISGGMSALAVTDDNIYIGTYNGVVYRSDDNGASWTDIDNGGYMPSVKITAILLTENATYVGTENKGIFKFTNNDHNMTTANNGRTHNNITDLEMQNDVIFASTWGGGIFASANEGKNWIAAKDGLDNLFVRLMAGEAVKIYAGTEGAVYQTNDDAFSRIVLLSGIRNQDARTGINFYPNPSKGIVKYTTDSPDSEVLIYNITGKLVYSSVSGVTGGTIDLTGFSKGIYLVKITGDNGCTRKLILE